MTVYMGRCIICGADVEGADICTFHEEDVLFSFTGNDPQQLIEGRFYEGAVDGLADFGVFVDLGNGVTGLLHRNELDRRLESLDWTAGDRVCVQVTDIADDGNVDLGPSIRQSPDEFRDTLEQGPEDGPAPEPVEDRPAPTATTASPRGGETLDRSQIRAIDRYFGREVLLEGLVDDIRQTGGPTVFELEDESGEVECAAFAGAGVRAYPDVESGDAVQVRGIVEHRFGDYQIEVERLERLEGDRAADVGKRVEDAASLPDSIDSLPLLYDDAANLAIETDIRDAAAAIRRAVEHGQPIRIRHPVSVDGYVAASALERAIESVLSDRVSAPQRRSLVRRRPIEEPEYELAGAIEDATRQPSAEEDQFVIIVDVGSTGEVTAAFDLLDELDIDYYVVDTANPTPTMLDRITPLVNPWCGEGTYPIPSTTSVAINVAGLVAEPARDELRHLPAVSGVDGMPDTARRLLEDSRFEEDDIETMREAVTLEAYYQPWEDKRALIRGILFERQAGSVEPISEQFRDKVDQAVETARYNAEVHPADGRDVLVLDTDRFGNRYEFPPMRVLLRSLLGAADVEGDVAVGIASDYIEVYTDGPVDLSGIASALQQRTEDAGISVRGGRYGRVQFLEGRRDDVARVAPDAIAAALAT